MREIQQLWATEEKIRELKDIEIKTIQNEAEEKNTEKERIRAKVICETYQAV